MISPESVIIAIFSPAESFFSPSMEAEEDAALAESVPLDASEEEDPLEEPHPASAAVVMAAASSKLTTFFFIIVFSFQEVQRFCVYGYIII